MDADVLRTNLELLVERINTIWGENLLGIEDTPNYEGQLVDIKYDGKKLLSYLTISDATMYLHGALMSAKQVKEGGRRIK